jgi:hypothetical protein
LTTVVAGFDPSVFRIFTSGSTDFFGNLLAANGFLGAAATLTGSTSSDFAIKSFKKGLVGAGLGWMDDVRTGTAGGVSLMEPLDADRSFKNGLLEFLALLVFTAATWFVIFVG